jgi:hypothetical protein
MGAESPPRTEVKNGTYLKCRMCSYASAFLINCRPFSALVLMLIDRKIGEPRIGVLP